MNCMYTVSHSLPYPTLPCSTLPPSPPPTQTVLFFYFYFSLFRTGDLFLSFLFRCRTIFFFLTFSNLSKHNVNLANAIARQTPFHYSITILPPSVRCAAVRRIPLTCFGVHSVRCQRAFPFFLLFFKASR